MQNEENMHLHLLQIANLLGLEVPIAIEGTTTEC